jgi:hypothetical protein
MTSTRSTTPRLTRSLIALALLPAAGGIAIASAGISAASGSTPTAHVQMVRSTTHAEPGDDHGADRSPTQPPKPTTHPAPKPTTRAPEVGDDHGDHATQTRDRDRDHGNEAGDDSVQRSASVRSVRSTVVRAPERGDDSGGHGGRTTVTRAPEPGDDHGDAVDRGDRGDRDSHSGSGHSDSGQGRHGGSDDGPNHS